MKRLLQIVLNAEGTVGGEQRHVLQILDGLDRDRFDVDVVTWNIPSFVEEVESRGVPTVAVTARRILDVSLLRRIEAVIAKGRYDLVHAHGHRAGLLGRLAAIRQRTPRILWTCHLAENKAAKNAFVRWGYSATLRYLEARTDATIAVSAFLRDWLISQGADGSRITVIQNGVDCSVFKPMPKDVALARELGLDPEAPIVGTVARLTEQKGVETFVSAAAEIQRSAPEIQVVIVGSGPLEGEIKTLAADIGARIVFAGERRDVVDLLALFDIAVLTSLWEGLPYTLLEAMASGTPVVCSDIPIFIEVTESGATARIFHAGDATGLGRAILELLGDRGEAARIAEAGMRMACDRFSAQRSSGATIAVYEQLLGGERF